MAPLAGRLLLVHAAAQRRLGRVAEPGRDHGALAQFVPPRSGSGVKGLPDLLGRGALDGGGVGEGAASDAEQGLVAQDEVADAGGRGAGVAEHEGVGGELDGGAVAEIVATVGTTAEFVVDDDGCGAVAGDQIDAAIEGVVVQGARGVGLDADDVEVLLEQPGGEGSGGGDDVGPGLVASGGLTGPEQGGDGEGSEALEGLGRELLDLVEVGEALAQDVGEDVVAEGAEVTGCEVEGIGGLFAELGGVVQGVLQGAPDELAEARGALSLGAWGDRAGRDLPTRGGVGLG